MRIEKVIILAWTVAQLISDHRHPRLRDGVMEVGLNDRSLNFVMRDIIDVMHGWLYEALLSHTGSNDGTRDQERVGEITQLHL